MDVDTKPRGLVKDPAGTDVEMKIRGLVMEKSYTGNWDGRITSLTPVHLILDFTRNRDTLSPHASAG